jgi:hypothetical protein
MKIPKCVIGESNVNVTSDGLVKNTLSPSIEVVLEVPKELELQKVDPLHEATRLLYVIDVAVFEIGELKFWRDCGPASAKYAALDV